MYSREFMVAFIAATVIIGLWFKGTVYAVEANYNNLPSNEFFRDGDIIPGSYQLYIQTGIGGGFWGLGPNQGQVKRSSFRIDAHADIRNYFEARDCKDCHREQTRDIHTVRLGISCRQCHINLPISGIHYYYSEMNPIRRHGYICAKCHIGASPSFAGYVIHEPSVVDIKAKQNFPLLYYAVWFMIILTGGVFIVFLPFTGLLLIREYAARLFGKSTQTTTDTTKRLIRFTPIQRFWHLALIIIFLLMSVTGFAWMYIETPWGNTLASWFGGIKQTVEIHKIAGLILLIGFAIHILYILSKVEWKKFPKSLSSPDSLLMGLRDFGKMLQHMCWTVGLCKAPRFERWAWWEKFGYWSVWWGFTISGITGLMLYNPVLTSDYMPGWLLNLALWIHRIEAVLAIGHVFTIHFLIAHMRPYNFPFNGAMFDGTISMKEARHDHPKWIARLEKNGQLEEMSVPEPSIAMRLLHFGIGYAIMVFAVVLLVFAIVNISAVTLL